MFTSSVGRFRARFPSQPTDLNVPASGTGSVQFNLQGAWCTSPITEIAAETSATPVPAAQQETAMEIALNSFSASAHQTAQGQAPTTSARTRGTDSDLHHTWGHSVDGDGVFLFRHAALHHRGSDRYRV